jgi:tetratricopeptide (TPR) repeat protein
MNARQQRTLDRLFEEAMALPSEKQAAFIAENCPDPEVRSELESLIACATVSPLSGVISAIGEVASSVASAELLGQNVGPYRLTGRIGQGGMGTVFRAVRADNQFQRTVAIKVLRFAHGDGTTLERFRYERQILAGLEHPHIARLLDGGEWNTPGIGGSQPYIVLEFVEGVPLTTYCREKKLGISQRLILFRQVCDALSYAHQRLVVHRDIKPANILVTADGTPKLLDFGVAKLLDPEISASANPPTSTALVAMTPDYASPEQVRGEPVSTASDVYSLGAVLYELLTSRKPHQILSNDYLEITRQVCEAEVRAPSLVAGRSLRGDLDVLVLKALQKDPSRRYISVEQFSEDIRRYLEGLPIVARPDTLMYRSAKFMRRHQFGVAAVAALFLVLVGGVAASTWEAMQAHQAQQAAVRERDRALSAERAATAAETKAVQQRSRTMAEKQRADMETARAVAVSDFLQKDLLEQAGASAQAANDNNPDPDLKVRTALDRAAARLPGRFATQPAVEAAIRYTIGTTYMDLGLFPEARRQLEYALLLRREVLGPEHPDTLRTMHQSAFLYMLQGKYPRAVQLFEKALRIQRRVLGEENPDTLNTMRELGSAYESQGMYPRAELLYIGALRLQRRVLGDQHPDVLNTMNNLATLYRTERKYTDAEALFGKILRIQRRVLGEEHPDTLTVINNLSTVYGYEGRYAQAEVLARQVVAIRNRVQGEEHPLTLSEMYNLAVLYRDEGKYPQADALLGKTLEIQRRVLGEEHPDTLDTKEALAVLYRIQSRHAQAEEMLNDVFGIRRRTEGEEAPDTLFTMENLGILYHNQGKYQEAESLFTKVLEIRRRVAGAQHPTTTPLLVMLGELMLEQKRCTEAEANFREALLRYEKTIPDNWRRFKTENILGASLAGQTRYAEAEPLLIAGYDGLVRRQATMPADSRPVLERAGQWIIGLYQDWGKPEKAAAWLERTRARVAAVDPHHPNPD